MPQSLLSFSSIPPSNRSRPHTVVINSTYHPLPLTTGWDQVADTVAHFRLPVDLSFDLYEQMFLEMLELRELDTARVLLEESPALRMMKGVDAKRQDRLRQLLSRPNFMETEVYAHGVSKKNRRDDIAKRTLLVVCLFILFLQTPRCIFQAG